MVREGGFLQVVNLNKVRKQLCRYQKNYMEVFGIFPCQLYDEVFILFLLPALSQVTSQTRYPHQRTLTKRGQLASQLTIPAIGNQPTNSSKQQHRRHKKLYLAKYRILIRLAAEYLQLTENKHAASISQLASYKL